MNQVHQKEPHVDSEFAAAKDNRRRLINFLLEPYTQMKLGFFANVLALLFALAVAFIVYLRTKDFFQIVIQLTEMESEVINLARDYAKDLFLWLGTLSVIYMLLNICASVYFTHRMIGPGIALRKHIRALGQGNYSVRTYLRRGDSMKEVAADLNALSELLEKKNSSH